MTGHVTAPAAALADQLPSWATLVRAPNPGPMTLEGTNTWVLAAPGAGGVLVVDPGPLDEGHLAAVAALGPVVGVLITHGHPDHTEGLDRFLELTGAERLGFGAAGSTVDAAGLRVRALVTPGHTADSLCFLIEGGDERAVCTGDTILGRGTTVVAHPDGDLGDYLDSLTALTAYDGTPALPGHGPALADCAVAARFYLAHRRARLDQVRRAVAEGASSPEQVVATVYADVDRTLWPAAEWSVRAQLAYLDQENRESGPGAGGLDIA
ncbi:MBL fold metallo-hydrolase [Plantactinospora soyae]|uniref:Glyoxylase-like metal-dependent hydrolase (Beta-lactamase superfamily II) n=1 Tax=Plantactinospora soyae TaxID=1544732 RepID=A0A927M2K6_9ACTN|nr:MBL fold metallo-hydrolase [Plantactinospora soyae]MBE1486469.1 glyoxylase-like metal-dependent hydrolase (beta-lactamase superfamily II) [Plantactinospora soyae]